MNSIFFRDAETRWSNVGCYVKSANATHTVCECTHLTNFAILMDVHGVHVILLISLLLKRVCYGMHMVR